MDEVLECRSLYEEANDAIRMRNSDHYRDYVRKKPLTPLLQNLLDEVHTQYAIAEARVRYMIYSYTVCVCMYISVLVCLCILCVYTCVPVSVYVSRGLCVCWNNACI